MSRERVVSASEVGDFVFCSRCWFLRLRGLKLPRYTPEMQAGSAAHNRLQTDAQHTFALRTVAVFLLLLGLVLLVLLLLVRQLF